MRRALCLGALATASGSSVESLGVDPHSPVDQHLQVAHGQSRAHELWLKMIGNPNEGYSLYSVLKETRSWPRAAQHSDQCPFLLGKSLSS